METKPKTEFLLEIKGTEIVRMVLCDKEIPINDLEISEDQDGYTFQFTGRFGEEAAWLGLAIRRPDPKDKDREQGLSVSPVGRNWGIRDPRFYETYTGKSGGYTEGKPADKAPSMIGNMKFNPGRCWVASE